MNDKKPDQTAPRTERICHNCGRFYREYPAISRRDNATEICPECGIREALESIGCKPDEQETILETIRRHQPQ